MPSFLFTRQSSLVLSQLLLLFASASLAYDPIKDFCRRWGHQSALVDGKLYVDGGMVNYKPFSASSSNASNPFFLYSDTTNSSLGGMPQIYANVSKNASIPSVSGGILWEDTVNKRLYLYGGEYYQTSPAPYQMYSYDILYDNWVSFGQPSGVGTINAVSYGAGVSIPSRGEAYYYGGWMSSASVPGWTGPPVATSKMIKFTMDTNSWANLTGPDDVRRAEGSMVFIPIGDAGMLIYFGGTQDLYANGTVTPQPLDTIFIYDVANTKWYKQKTSGRTPEIRRRFCAGATWAQDQSSYNIYLYGGLSFPPNTTGYANTTGYDDVYILTIPTFQWIRGPYPPSSNVTGSFPKFDMTCNVVNNAQMIVIGGTYTNDTTYMCDADTVWGEHNMDLGEQNPQNAIWALYQPNLTTYAVPTDILTAIGGRNTGGAVKTTPTSGFDAPDLSVLMTRKALTGSRTATRNVNLSTAGPSLTPSPTPGPSTPVLSTGAIAGIAVGGGVALILLIGCCCAFFVRRRKARREVAAARAASVQGAPYYRSSVATSAWVGSNHAEAPTHVSSPTLTTISHSRAQATSPSPMPIAELGGDHADSGAYKGNLTPTHETLSEQEIRESQLGGGQLHHGPGPVPLHWPVGNEQ